MMRSSIRQTSIMSIALALATLADGEREPAPPRRFAEGARALSEKKVRRAKRKQKRNR